MATRKRRSTTKSSPREMMIVNDVPGVECRIAILVDGKLDELYTERTSQATSVGNIYKGRVINVESAIQAAFVDYGAPQRGFLHITDVHPKHFPGKGEKERVGKKIARRARPPIQDCLKKGDEILVQVLKEGLGTKGPTLTSYLSIPGRLAVMMPYMDKVGVSRRIEDDDERKAMKKKLDDLNLPEGFGFILRTAGMDKTKTEIKRDIAYLLRLWKVMEKRIDGVGAPCPLYTESDLLIRTIRDILRPSIEAVVVDSQSGYERISAFLKVSAPRSTRQVVRYGNTAPIFHAFDIEEQIEQIHDREVSLPSGGRLVIDQTEALVAIDVNSGRSRSARDSETNAYRTNLEAADEICRQLRLRDLGGLIVNDLIDMNSASHRRKVEETFEANLERDRARSNTLPISRFGLLQMTRQRMRPSVLDSHYVGCVHCDSRGQVKSPEEVASEATRHAGWLLWHERIHRVEIACSPAVATVIVSSKRRELDRYEDTLGKRAVVRVSMSIATDRVAFFAYDDRGGDVDPGSLPKSAVPTLKQLIAAEADINHEDDVEESTKEGSGRRRGRRRGQRKPPAADATTIALSDDFEEELAALAAPAQEAERKPRRSRGGRGRGKKQEEQQTPSSERVYELARRVGSTSKDVLECCRKADIELKNHMSTIAGDLVTRVERLLGGDDEEEAAPKKRRRRRGRRGGRRRRRGRGQRSEETTDGQEQASGDEVVAEAATKEKPSSRRSSSKKKTAEKAEPKKKTSRRRRSRRTAKKDGDGKAIEKVATKVEPKPRRSLYGAGRRTVTSSEAKQARDSAE